MVAVSAAELEAVVSPAAVSAVELDALVSTAVASLLEAAVSVAVVEAGNGKCTTDVGWETFGNDNGYLENSGGDGREDG